MVDLDLSSVRLPPAFQECEYLRFAAYKSVNVYFTIDNIASIRMVGRGSFDRFASYNIADIFRLWSDGTVAVLNYRTAYEACMQYVNKDTGNHEYAKTASYKTVGTPIDYDCTFTPTSISCVVDGTSTTISKNIKTSTVNRIIYGNASYPGYSTIYGKQDIYINGVLTYSLVPCYLKTAWNGIAAGTIGLYDLLGTLSSNGTPFCTVAGSGPAEKGPDVVHADAITINGKDVDRLTDATGTAWSKLGAMLPTAFQRCEYVESHGTEWIDTKLNYHNNHEFDEVRIKCQMNRYAYNLTAVFGVSQTNASYTNDFVITAPSNNSFCWIIGSSMNTILSSPIGKTVEFLAKYANSHKKLIVNGQTVVDADYSYTFASYAGTATLFSNRLGQSVYHFWDGYVWNAEIYLNGVPVRRYVPCYLKTAWNGIPAGTIGMYDLCGSISSNGTPFYTNEGTGTFTKGPDV